MPTKGKGLVRFRMDEALIAQTETMLDRMGLSLSNVVTMLSRRIVAEGKLPFEVYAVSTPLERTRAAVAESLATINRPEGRFDSAQTLFDTLEKGNG
jgi:addiction module RelB/DinJ family antitoxin